MTDLGQERGLEKLLIDNDPDTIALLQSAIFENKFRYESLVQRFASSGDSRLHAFARNMLQKWRWNLNDISNFDLPTELRDLSWARLEIFCWCLVAQEEPQYLNDWVLSELDRITDHVRDLLKEESAVSITTTKRKIALLCKVIIDQEGFSANIQNYYAPENNYLSHVLTDKAGIPLTLSLLFIFVGRRLGWNVIGLDTPGHYLCALDGVVFDPFYGGMIVAPKEFARRFRTPSGQWQDLCEWYATPAGTAKRLLCNLLNSYIMKGDEERFHRIHIYLEMFPEAPEFERHGPTSTPQA